VYQRISEELARQRQADMRRLAASRQCRWPADGMPAGAALARTGLVRRRRAGSACAGTSVLDVGHGRDASRSLRARAGWWLVGLGLKLAVGPRSRAAASPRPAGS